MEKRYNYKIFLKILLLLVLVVAIIIAVLVYNGNIKFNFNNKNNNNEVNIYQSTNFDPYAKYKDIKWIRDTSTDGLNSINTPDKSDEWISEHKNIKAWIDSQGIVNVENTANNSSAKVTNITEKAKYIAIRFDPQDLYGRNVVFILTEDQNLYIVYYTLEYNTNNVKIDQTDVHKIQSDSKILEMTYNIDTAPHPWVDNYYCLTEDGQLKLINYNTGYNLGITFEDNNQYKEVFGTIDCLVAIDSSKYLKDASDSKNYIKYNEKTIKVKYLFIPEDVENSPIYCITDDNEFLSITNLNGYDVKIYTNKIASNVSYLASPDTQTVFNSGKITVNYTDGTSDVFQISNDSKYGL